MAEDMISTSFNGPSLEQGSMPNFRSFKDDLVRVALFLEDEKALTIVARRRVSVSIRTENCVTVILKAAAIETFP